MMRTFLALLLLSASAQASLIHVEITHDVIPIASDWRLPGPVPSQFNVSFDLDTLSADFTSYVLGHSVAGPPGACLMSFDLRGLDITNVVARADGTTLWNAPMLSASYRGDNAGGTCPGGFFSALGFQDSARFGASIDVFPGLSQDSFLRSDDPLRDLLFGFDHFVGSGSLSGEWGSLTGGIEPVIVKDVPEPGMLALLVTGLLGLAATRARRQKIGISPTP